jgi:type IV pilus assembly protein PilW
MREHDPLRRQGGLTLIEIMVALVVSLILIAGVIQIFVGTRQTYRFQDALARVQENGRYAAEVIGRDARLAGYSGCTTLVSVTPRAIPPLAVDYSRDTYIFGNDPGLPAQPGTDTLTLRMLSPNTVRLSADMTAPSDDITIDTNIPDLAVNQIVGIADCNNVDIFRVNTVAGTGPVTITPHDDLTKAYLTGSILSRFQEVSYFVQPGLSGALALWRRDAAGDTELVEGVEDLWLRYGVDTNNDGAANIYAEAAGVADWSRVRSIRVSLLLASNEDNVTGGAQPVDFRGGTVTDSRYKQVLTTTIGLRNRLP